MEQLHLIVGLGNPGAEYARTRHNTGFQLVERLAERWGAGWTLEKKFNAQVAWANRAEARVLLCKPQTYMNSSGETVGPLTAYYRAPLKRMMVVVDDADLPLGEIRMRAGGSSGGHHGLESIERHVGTRTFPRLRIGIGRMVGAREITGHVLGRFSPEEAVLAGRILAAACDQVECWLNAGIERAMNEFNGNRIDRDSANERKEQ